MDFDGLPTLQVGITRLKVGISPKNLQARRLLEVPHDVNIPEYLNSSLLSQVEGIWDSILVQYMAMQDFSIRIVELSEKGLRIAC